MADWRGRDRMMRTVAILMAALAVAWAAIDGGVRLARRRGWAEMRAEMRGDLEVGSLDRLLHARALGLRILLGEPGDRDGRALLALASALLAVEHGLGTDVEAATIADGVDAGGSSGGGGQPAARTALLETARAFLALRAGQLRAAGEKAARAADAARDDVYPLLALARVRARAGDMVGASRTLEAALVKTPGHGLARLLWAEARIDLGDTAAAAGALRALLARTPDDTRARLLLAETDRISPAPAPASAPASASASASNGTAVAEDLLRAGCERDSPRSPATAAGCRLGEALKARLGGNRRAAREAARAAAAIVPAEPRALASTAHLLAELGEVDSAAALLARAVRLAGRSMPPLPWAELAITLGRGRVEAAPPPARATTPEARLLVARAALAAGGGVGLRAALQRLGPSPVRDPDMAALALLARPDPGEASPPVIRERVAPVAAYVSGLRARLRGDAQAAATWLSAALDDHGDACRAAGEYTAVLRALGRGEPRESELRPLRASNRDCVNLPGR